MMITMGRASIVLSLSSLALSTFLCIAACSSTQDSNYRLADGNGVTTGTSGATSSSSSSSSGEWDGGPRTTAEALANERKAHGWGPGACPPPPQGVSVGIDTDQQIMDFTVKDCEGHDVPLSDLCGAKSTWAFFAHSWCVPCQAVGAFGESVQHKYASRGLASIVVIVEGGTGMPPTKEDCQAWRDKFGENEVLTFFDPEQKTLQLFDNNNTTLSVFMDKDRVMWRKFHSHLEADVTSSIETSLAR
jgi:hypothetical protein